MKQGGALGGQPRHLLRLSLGVAAALAAGLLLSVLTGTSGGALVMGTAPPAVPIKALLRTALQLTQQAGVTCVAGADSAMWQRRSTRTPCHRRSVVDIAKSGKLGERSKGVLAGGVNDPLTAADLASHRQLSAGFSAAFPGVTLVSEEKDSGGSDGGGALPALADAYTGVLASMPDDVAAEGDVVVWIDPLDATKEYTEGLTQYVTVMACITVRGVPVAGVVHYPFQRRSLWAWAGSGVGVVNTTAAGGAPWGTRAPSPPWRSAGVRAIVSRSHAGKVKQHVAATGLSLAGVTPAGGAGYKVGAVLTGRADVYLHSTAIKKWDICAGDALLRAEAAVGGAWEGGMRDWHGREVAYGAGEAVKLRDGLLAVDDPALYHAMQPALSKLADARDAAEKN